MDGLAYYPDGHHGVRTPMDQKTNQHDLERNFELNESQQPNSIGIHSHTEGKIKSPY